jgi:mediator of RNA polymerase II transcription subunit 25
MNQREYQRKAEFLVFRPPTAHDFLVQLADKKLCAVIQLPSQTLLLTSPEKAGRMIGMLFPAVRSCDFDTIFETE